MDATRLSAITAQLETEHAQLLSKEESLRLELEDVQADRARVEQALAALTGKERKASVKPLANGRKKPDGQAPKKLDVLQAMVAVLKREGVLEREALKSHVETELLEKGFNRFGLAMRFNEACQDKLLVETPGGMRLTDESLEADSKSVPSTTRHPVAAAASSPDGSHTAVSREKKSSASIA